MVRIDYMDVSFMLPSNIYLKISRSQLGCSLIQNLSTRSFLSVDIYRRDKTYSTSRLLHTTCIQ